ncbi:calaxin-like [Leptinotarsa decemlineata]|uniref:calaxin-like n=1 Tax=Leptinotarsa decemlineata TaxID=7539 RepID=UPI003D30C5FF
MNPKKSCRPSVYYTQTPLDAYNQTLDETRFLKRYDKFTKKMANETHFNEEEIQSLVLIHYRFLTDEQKSRKTMTNEQILSVLIDTFDMTNEKMANNVAMALDWKTGGQKITKARWLRMLSLFLRGSLREKIKFCFSVYDTRRTGFLSRELLFGYLNKAFFNTDGKPDEESTRDMVDILMKKMDHDRDGKISFKDYKTSVLRQPCLLEFLGQCLPDKRACIRFSTSWARNVVLNESQVYFC